MFSFLFRPAVKHIARTAHEVNRAYCAAIGDDSQKPWDEAPQWQRDSAIAGVKFLLAEPAATPQDSHNSWWREKRLDGWVYGPRKNATKKTHPCMVEYSELPKKQRLKDHLFLAVVRSMSA